MSGIKIITDSASDLPEELRAINGIGVVDLDVRLGSAGEMLTGLSPEQFWVRARQSQELAQTAAPSPGAFAQAFLAAHEQGYDSVCCVTISSELSATYEAALTGAREVEGQIEVAVVDSRFATMGEGLLVLEAAERARAEGSLAEVVGATKAAIDSVSVFGTLESLETLRRGGRIGSAQALVGSMLSIKPVVEVRNGVVEAESRQRTRGRSLNYLLEKAREALPLKRLALVHAAAGDFDAFVAMFSDFDPGIEMITGYIGPTIGAHTGPGTVGVCLQRT